MLWQFAKGLVYRSATPDYITTSEVMKFVDDLGLGVFLDLRSNKEAQEACQRVPDGAELDASANPGRTLRILHLDTSDRQKLSSYLRPLDRSPNVHRASLSSRGSPAETAWKTAHKKTIHKREQGFESESKLDSDPTSLRTSDRDSSVFVPMVLRCPFDGRAGVKEAVFARATVPQFLKYAGVRFCCCDEMGAREVMMPVLAQISLAEFTIK